MTHRTIIILIILLLSGCNSSIGPGTNTLFVADGIPERIDICADSCKTPVVLQSTLKEGFPVTLTLYPGNDITASVKLPNNQEQMLDSGHLSEASLALCDLDGDGTKEVLLHSGVWLGISIYGLSTDESELVLIGKMANNDGFEISEDYTITSYYGVRGEATIAKVVNNTLVIIKDTIFPYNKYIEGLDVTLLEED